MGVEDKVQPPAARPGTEPARWDAIRKATTVRTRWSCSGDPRRSSTARARASPATSPCVPTPAPSPWSAGADSRRLRPEPDTALIALDLKIRRGGPGTIVPPLLAFIDERVEPPVESHVSGEAPLGKELNEATTEGAHKAELIAAPVLVIVLLLVFRSPVAAAIPLIMGQATVLASFGVVSIILSFTSLDAIALSLASGVGLALGVDYSLLIITRFREALDDGLAPRQAASLAANTAGRTAVFAGTVLVAIMMVSFFLSPGTVLLSSAVGSIVSAMLSMIGRRWSPRPPCGCSATT